MNIVPMPSSGEDSRSNQALPDDADVNVTEVLAESQIMEVLDKLDQELVGLKSVDRKSVV